jgi:hypothetical protein
VKLSAVKVLRIPDAPPHRRSVLSSIAPKTRGEVAVGSIDDLLDGRDLLL